MIRGRVRLCAFEIALRWGESEELSVKRDGNLFGALVVLVAACSAAEAAKHKDGDLWFEPYSVTTATGSVMPAEMGHFVVKENRRSAQSHLIELVFLRIKSTAASPGPPIFILAGGPGGSGINIARNYALHFPALPEIGDVIGVDQRGAGLSRPSLESHETYEYPLDEPIDPKKMADLIRDASRRAAEKLRAEEIDLNGYNTNENADDFDALRQALGAEKMFLIGRSYGTHLGLVILRRHGEHVAGASLTGVEGPDYTLKLPSYAQQNLEAVTFLLDRNPLLKAAIPDFIGLVKSVLERVERDPVRVTADDPTTGKSVTVAVGKFELQAWTANRICRGSTVTDVPAVFLAMSKGDFSHLGPVALAMHRGGVGSAMAAVMDCASGASADRLRKIEEEKGKTLLGDAIDFPSLEACGPWGISDLGDEYRSNFKCEVPVIFASGTLDGRTPVRNVLEIIGNFPNASHVIVENAGHDTFLFENNDVMAAAVRMMKGERVESARVSIPPPELLLKLN